MRDLWNKIISFIRGLKRKKRTAAFAVIFLLLIVLWVLGVRGYLHIKEENQFISRDAWCILLSEADNAGGSGKYTQYFSDIGTHSRGFRQISDLVQAGILSHDDDKFHPGTAADREFVAETAVKAAGYFQNTSLAFKDENKIEDRNSAGTAVQSKLLPAEADGYFEPDKPVTMAQSRQIIAKLKTILAQPKTDQKAESRITLKKGVKNLRSQNRAEFTYGAPNSNTINMPADRAASLAVGNIFVLPDSAQYPNGLAGRVARITVSGNTAAVEYTIPDISQVVDTINISGSFAPDSKRVHCAPGVTLTGQTLQTASPGRDLRPSELAVQPGIREKKASGPADKTSDYQFKIQTEIFHGTMELDIAGLTADMNARISPLQIKEARLALNADCKISGKVAGQSISKENEKFDVAEIPFPIGDGVSVDLELSCELNAEGQLTVSYEIPAEFGIAIENNMPRKIAEFGKGSLNAEVSGDISLLGDAGLTLNCFEFTLADAGLELGPEMSIRPDPKDSASGRWSLYLASDLYAFKSRESLAGKLFPSTRLVIWDEDNSPYLLSGRFASATYAADSGKPPSQVKNTQTDGFTGNGAGNDETVKYDNGWIYYLNYNDGDKLYRESLDGAVTQELTENDSGDFTLNGGWIYYSNPAGLYRIKADGTANQKLDSDIAEDIAVNGGWIYYILQNPGIRQAVNGTPCRIKTDGTGRQRLSDDDLSAFIGFSGGWIYYAGSTGQIVRLNPGSLEKQQLSTVVNDYSATPRIADGWIYYLDENQRLWRVKTDGTGGRQLNDKTTGNFLVYKNQIYYTSNDSSADGLESRLYRVSTDGANSRRLSDDTVLDFNIADDKIYYVSQSNTIGLCRMGIDGSGKQVLCTDTTQNFYYGKVNVAGGWVYLYENYRSVDPQTNLQLRFHYFRMRPDGSQKEPVQ